MDSFFNQIHYQTLGFNLSKSTFRLLIRIRISLSETLIHKFSKCTKIQNSSALLQDSCTWNVKTLLTLISNDLLLQTFYFSIKWMSVEACSWNQSNNFILVYLSITLVSFSDNETQFNLRYNSLNQDPFIRTAI